jgi:hypothetical protein
VATEAAKHREKCFDIEAQVAVQGSHPTPQALGMAMNLLFPVECLIAFGPSGNWDHRAARERIGWRRR